MTWEAFLIGPKARNRNFHNFLPVTERVKEQMNE